MPMPFTQNTTPLFSPAAPHQIYYSHSKSQVLAANPPNYDVDIDARIINHLCIPLILSVLVQNRPFRTFDELHLIYWYLVEICITASQHEARRFGYYPVFIPEGSELTFPEMGMLEKSKSNHGVRALEKFLGLLQGMS